MRFRSSTVGLALSLVCIPWLASAQALDNLAPGEWYEAPNSHIADHMPDPLPPNWSGPGALIGSWNSGAYDSIRDRLIVWGGGHNDYGGNEVYVFDVETMAWSRIWGPSPNIPEAGNDPCNETYPDGNPASRHTYDAIEFLPSVDRFWSQGGSLFCGNGNGTAATWLFDFGALEWTQAADFSSTYYETLGAVSAYDPVTGNVFEQATRMFGEYDPIANTWTERGVEDAGVWSDKWTAALDPIRRVFVGVGQGTFLRWDLSSWALDYPTSTGGDAVINANAPGFEYDPSTLR